MRRRVDGPDAGAVDLAAPRNTALATGHPNDLRGRATGRCLGGKPFPMTSMSKERGRAMAYLEVSAHLTVRPGCLEGFKAQAAEIMRITREKDTRTLRYDWFLSSDGTECEVREAYAGPEGLIEHNTHVIDARTKLFRDY